MASRTVGSVRSRTPESAAGNACDGLDAVKVPCTRLGESSQAAQLRKRIAQVLAVRVDNGDLNPPWTVVKEDEVGTHSPPVILDLVGNHEGITRWAGRVPVPRLESRAAHLSVEHLELPLVQ